MKTWKGEGTFAENAKREAEIAARLSPEEIDRLCSLDTHFKHVYATFKALGLEYTWCCTKGLDDLGCGTVLGTGDGRLFVTQRFDRIEVGCTIRGVKSEADADGGADQKSSDGPAVGENDVDLEPSCEQVSRNDPKNYSENSTGFRNEHGFGEELAQDVATACAD